MLTPFAAVMNYTEMEAKVREATNNEPWGASSTYVLSFDLCIVVMLILKCYSLMQEIASGTHN